LDIPGTTFPKQKEITHILPDPDNAGNAKNSVNSILIDRKGVIWVGTAKGLGYLQPESRTNKGQQTKKQTIFSFHSFDTPKALSAFSQEFIFKITEDKNDIIWLMMKNNLVRINRSKKNSRVKVYSHRSGTYPVEYRGSQSSRFWINLDENHLLFDPLSEKFQNIAFDSKDHKSLKHHFVSSMIETRDGIYFLGTLWGGLFKYDPFSRFKEYHPALQQIYLGKHDNLRFVFEDSRGDLWFATRDVYRCNRTTGKVLAVLSEKDFPSRWGYKNSIIEDRSGHIWIGAESEGLYRINSKNFHISRFNLFKNIEQKNKYKGVEKVTVTALNTDHRGNIWIGALLTYNDEWTNQTILFKLNSETFKVQVFPIVTWENRISIQTEDLFIYHIYPSVFKDIWLATGFGLVCFIEQQAETVIFQHNQKESNSLSHNRVKTICPDPFHPERFIWLGTEGGGLNRFDKIQKSFIHFTIQDGLPSNHISSILSDEGGNLWLATKQGISKAILKDDPEMIESFHNYDQLDGLNGSDFTFFYGHNAFKTDQNEFIFTAPKGFNVFKPDEIKENSNVPVVVVSDFDIHYQSVSSADSDLILQTPISKTREITLPYDQNTLTFELTALHFRAPNKNQYAFMMAGYDKGWIQNGTNRTAHYTNVPPGDYTFHVQAANSDGIWNREGASIKIIITPPWWRTWWAYSIVGIVFLTIFLSARHYELRRQELKLKLELKDVQAEKLQEIDKMKSRFFANISHEFRTPLTLILGPVEDMMAKFPEKKSQQELSLVRRNAQRLLRLINQLLDLSKIESNKLKLQVAAGNFIGFLKNNVMFFESMAQSRGVDLQFKVESCTGFDSTQHFQEQYFDHDKIEKIFSNLLFNAFKYTAEGDSVSVTATLIKACRMQLADADSGYEYEIRSPACEAHRISLSANRCQSTTDDVSGVLITVKDTGLGIPADSLSNIFDRFYQATEESEASNYSSGTTESSGIGLALVKELVDLHHGMIKVESEKNQGTTFTICLPLGKAHFQEDGIIGTAFGEAYRDTRLVAEMPLTEAVSPSLHSPVDDGSKGSVNDIFVLLIEDSSDMRGYIRENLESDYKVIEAEDGEQGVNCAFDTIPDLIICDVMMPKMNGFQVCQRLKTDERTSHIPIILLTAKAEAENKIAGLETGADDYLFKPFYAKELRVRMQNLIELRRKLRLRFSNITIVKPAELDITSVDKKFLQRLLDIVESHLSDETFGVEELCKEIGMSSPSLWRKIQGLFNKNPNQFIRSIRLQHAQQMLEENAGNIAEISLAVGFSNPSYFARCFQEQFGKSPSHFKRTQEKKA